MRENAKPELSHTLYPLPSVSIFSRWNIDFVGPLPESRKGSRYLIVAVEYVSKWVIAKALTHTLAETIRDFLYNEIVTVFGVPDELISDRGTNFMSNVVQSFNSLMKIHHKKTTAYHPRTNGAVVLRIG